MDTSDRLAGGFDGAAGTLAAAFTAPAKELAAAADRDIHDMFAFVHGLGDEAKLWPHPKNRDMREPVQVTNAALIDETTLYVARQLIAGESPLTPLTLMDLSTYVTTFVLRDEVVRNRWYGTGAVGETGPLALPSGLPTRRAPESGLTLAATQLWEQRLRRADSADARMAADLHEGWQALLGSDAPRADQMFLEDMALDRLNSRQVMHGLQRPARRRRGRAEWHYDHRVPAPIDELDPDETVAEAVAFCNLRGLYNLEFARDIGVPYAGSVTRLPVRRYLWRQGRLGDALLTAAGPDLAISRTLDDAFRKRVKDALVQREAQVVLPPLLAAVIVSIARLDEFDDRLLELREQAAPLRRRIGEIEAALGSNDPAEITKTERQLFSAFADDARLFATRKDAVWPALTSTIGSVASATTGQSAWVTAAVGTIAAASGVVVPKVDAVRNRLTRRHLWFVTELAGWCDAIQDATPHLRRLWRRSGGAAVDDAFHEQLEGVRRLGYM
jgi:hypothetical protein